MAGGPEYDRSCRRVVVRGRVQGVGFRWRTRERAQTLGLDGWVRNLRDGGVEVRIEGPEDRVEVLCEWLRRGPRNASVVECSVSEETAGREPAVGFEIRPSA